MYQRVSAKGYFYTVPTGNLKSRTYEFFLNCGTNDHDLCIPDIAMHPIHVQICVFSANMLCIAI